MSTQQRGDSTGGARLRPGARRRPAWLLPALLVVGVGATAWAFLLRPSAETRVDRLMAKARTARTARDFDTAEKCLLEARRYAPGSGVLMHNLAILYLEQDRLEDARAAFERAASMYRPEAGQTKAEELFQLAQLSFREGKWTQVASELEQAIAADPTRGQLHMRLVDLQLAQMHDVAAADSSTSRFLRVCGRTAHNFDDLALVNYHGGYLERTESLARRAVALSDSLTSAHVLVAESMWKSKRLEEGLRYLEGPLQRYPRAADLWVAKGSLLQGAGRSEEAVAALDRGLALDPKDYEGHYARLVALTKLGRYSEALREMESCRGLTDDPNEQRLLQSRRDQLRHLMGAGKGTAPGAAGHDSTAGAVPGAAAPAKPPAAGARP